MRHFLSFIFLVCMLGNSNAQSVDLDKANTFYVCLKNKEYSNFVVSDYQFYDKNTYKNEGDAIQSSRIDCRLIKYGKNAIGGKHCMLVVNFKDTIDWSKNKCYLEHSFSYIATKEETNELKMINMQVPVDLSLAISTELNKTLNYKKKNKYDGWGKNEMGEVEFIAEKIRSSYLYDEVNSILTKYKMSIDDIDIIEPTLLFTKEKFLEVYPKYSNRNLPKRILGLYVAFVLKPIL